MGPEMALFAAAAQAASSFVEGVGEYQQGRHEAAIAEQNAKLATDNAARARQDAAMAEEAQRGEARKSLGRSAAAASQSGAAGGGVSKGSYGRVIEQASRGAELDALNIRYGGEMQAYGHGIEAAQFRAERKAALQRAKGGLLSGIFGSAAKGLSGASDYRVARAQGTYGNPNWTPAPSAPRAPVVPTAPTTRRRHYTQFGSRY